MKTPVIINRIATLIATSVLVAAPGHAAQNFIETFNFATGDSNAGMTASLVASDDITHPTSGLTRSDYSVTAGGNVNSRFLGTMTTAAEGRGTVKVQILRVPSLEPKLSATVSGSLKVFGTSVLNVANLIPGGYSSPHFVRQRKESKTILIAGIKVTAKVTTTVDAQLQARANVIQPGLPNLGEPSVSLSIGPVVDAVAVAQTPSVVILPGFTVPGNTATSRLGKVALIANAKVIPILETPVVNGLEFPPRIVHATADVLVNAETRGTNSPGSVTRTLLGPVQFSLF